MTPVAFCSSLTRFNSDASLKSSRVKTQARLSVLPALSRLYQDVAPLATRKLKAQREKLPCNFWRSTNRPHRTPFARCSRPQCQTKHSQERNNGREWANGANGRWERLERMQKFHTEGSIVRAHSTQPARLFSGVASRPWHPATQAVTPHAYRNERAQLRRQAAAFGVGLPSSRKATMMHSVFMQRYRYSQQLGTFLRTGVRNGRPSQRKLPDLKPMTLGKDQAGSRGTAETEARRTDDDEGVELRKTSGRKIDHEQTRTRWWCVHTSKDARKHDTLNANANTDTQCMGDWERNTDARSNRWGLGRS
ncbi:hypothetical protein C8F01DRAFT_1234759 [Mycena amicta]|nr:hypothetical protein C8F01DRAFT_1234759 [Mycena amicta]